MYKHTPKYLKVHYFFQTYPQLTIIRTLRRSHKLWGIAVDTSRTRVHSTCMHDHTSRNAASWLIVRTPATAQISAVHIISSSTFVVHYATQHRQIVTVRHHCEPNWILLNAVHYRTRRAAVRMPENSYDRTHHQSPASDAVNHS